MNEILRTIARDGRILEVNSSSYHAGSDTLPAFDIVKRYFELGGRLLNFGSDAHEKERLGAKYSVFSDMAKAAGFSEIAIAVGRKITTVPIL